jgi:dTDP-4-amino-4,6-dideoxygalactose transaminase
MYVPSWQGLAPGYFFRTARVAPPPFPLNAPHTTFAFMARNVIYHLFRALALPRDQIVLMPDYNSGVEDWAIRAAGASLRYYPIKRNLQPDLDALAQLCKSTNARVLYVIHFLGFPQPMKELTALARQHDLILIEDCCLALLSESGGEPLGKVADYSIFCLYKTLPVPHGGVLVQNRNVLESLTRLELPPCGLASLTAWTLDLFLERIRARSNAVGRALWYLKRGAGLTLTALGIKRLPVGDISPDFSSIGFDVTSMEVGMSPICQRLLKRFDYEAIRRRRRENYAHMRERLAGRVSMVREELEPGMCPLIFPVLVPDKRAAARALQARGVSAVEFWNYGYTAGEGQFGADAQYLRAHLLELPIHQDITPQQVQYTADQVLRLQGLF